MIEGVIMNDYRIEVLEPFQGEILYSWVSRMFNWYGYNNTQTNIRKFNNEVFGKASKTVTNVLIPYNLENLISNVNLPNSMYFESIESIIQKTTIMPFYTAFITLSDKKKIYEYLKINKPARISKAIIGLNGVKTFSITDFKFKFCYKCWKENNYLYFDSEHQILNNYICYKHKTRLQYIEGNSNEYFQFNNINIDDIKNAPYCIPIDDYFDSYKEISDMIHDIFINGFKDDIIKLKSKLRMRMKSLGFMDNNFNYLEKVDKFMEDFKPFNVLKIESMGN